MQVNHVFESRENYHSRIEAPVEIKKQGDFDVLEDIPLEFGVYGELIYHIFDIYLLNWRMDLEIQTRQELLLEVNHSPAVDRNRLDKISELRRVDFLKFGADKKCRDRYNFKLVHQDDI